MILVVPLVVIALLLAIRAHRAAADAADRITAIRDRLQRIDAELKSLNRSAVSVAPRVTREAIPSPVQTPPPAVPAP